MTPCLKQKTVSVGAESRTIGLKRRKDTRRTGGKYVYSVEDLDTGTKFGDAFTDKRDAEREFRRVVEDVRGGMELASPDGRGGVDFPFMPD